MGEDAWGAQAEGVVGGSQVQPPGTATRVCVAKHETLLSEERFI